MDARRFLSLVKESFGEWNKDNASLLAAGLAYYTLFSISPLVIILVVLVGIILGPGASQGDIVEAMSGFVGPQVAVMIEDAIRNVSNPASSLTATVIAFALLFFGATGLFLQTKRGLGIIFAAGNKDGVVVGTIKSYFRSMLLIVIVGFLLLLAGIMTAVLSSTGRYMKPYMNQFPPFDVGLLQIINLVVFLVFVTILFAFTYKTLSGVKLLWKDVFPGAALAALLFAAGNILLQLYVENIAVGSVYGAASTLVVALLWIYYSAQIFFFGAEFVKVYGRARGSHYYGL